MREEEVAGSAANLHPRTQLRVRVVGTDLFAPNITQTLSRRQTTGTELGFHTRPGKYNMFLQVGKPSGSSFVLSLLSPTSSNLDLISQL